MNYRTVALIGCLLGTIILPVLAAALPANIESLRPIRGMSYNPAPSNHKDQGPPVDPAFQFDEWNPYFDSDYWNSGNRGFDHIWDDVGRGDLTKLKNQTIGTAVIALQYDTNNKLTVTFHRISFSMVEIGETDGLVTVAVGTLGNAPVTTAGVTGPSPVA